MELPLDALRESLYLAVREALDRFAATPDNRDLYALVFDCDSETGQICLRYANLAHFGRMLADYEQYRYLYEPYGKYGLRGYQYDVGGFPFIDFDYPPLFARFLDTYYYHATGDFCGEGEPIPGLGDSCGAIWRDTIVSCIERIKTSYTGLCTTEDFIVYWCDHDQSDEDAERLIRQTVEPSLFQKLLDDSYR